MKSSDAQNWDASAPNNLDAIRFILASIVLFYHCYPFLGIRDGEPLKWLTGGLWCSGTCAVAGFFVLSGFLIARSMDHSRSALEFLRRRAARIYPAYLTAIVFGWCIVGWVAADDPVRYWMSIPWRSAIPLLIREVVFLQRIDLPPSVHVWPGMAEPLINGSSWTVPFEATCYLVVLLMGLSGSLRGRRRWVLPAMLIGVVGWSWWWSGPIVIPKWLHAGDFGPDAFPVLPNLLGEHWPLFVAHFLVGACAYVFREYVPRRLSLAAGAAAMLAAATFWRLQIGSGDLMPIEVITSSYVLLYIAFARRPLLSDWTSWTGGDLSYGLYLSAWPVTQLVILASRHAHVTLTPTILGVIAYPLSIGCAALSWHLVERRFLPGRRRPSAAIPARVATVTVAT